MNLKAYDKIDSKSKFLIDGYIRNIQTLFDKNIYFNIPISINYICAIFYFITFDEWDEKRKGDFVIDKVSNIITKESNKRGSVFLTNIVDQDKHVWKFKMIEYKRQSNDFMIGIWDLNGDRKPLVNEWLGSIANTCYAYLISRAILNIPNKNNGWHYNQTYGVCLETGDIVSMYLDFNALTLSFTVNGTDYGVAHSIKKSKYIAAIGATSARGSVQLMEYQHIVEKCNNTTNQ